MNENYPAYARQEHTPTSQSTLCFLIKGTYHLELNPNPLCCLPSSMWSGPSLFFTYYSGKMGFPQTFHYSKLVPVLELVYFLVTFALSIPSAWNILSPHLAMASLSSNVTSSDKPSSAVTSVSLTIVWIYLIHLFVFLFLSPTRTEAPQGKEPCPFLFLHCIPNDQLAAQ